MVYWYGRGNTLRTIGEAYYTWPKVINKLPGLSARVLILFNWKNGCSWNLQLSSLCLLSLSFPNIVSDSGEGKENLYTAVYYHHICV